MKLFLLAKVTASAVFIVGIFVLIGWIAGSEILQRLFISNTAMKPTTAFAFTIAGASLLFAAGENSFFNKYGRIAGGLLIIYLGGSTTLYFLTDIDISVDMLFLAGNSITHENLQMVRMAPATSFNFLIAGVTLLFISKKTANIFQQVVILVLIIALFSIIVTFFNYQLIDLSDEFRKMALISAFTFIFMAISLLSLLSNEIDNSEQNNWGIINGKWKGYILAVVFVAAAASLRIWPLHSLEMKTTWVTYYPAVMVAALFGGFYSGLFAAILSCFIVLFLWPIFVSSPFIKDFGDWLSLSVFFATSLMISIISENLLKEKEKVKKMNTCLELSNQKLKQEVAIRVEAEDEIIKLNKELEERVLDRTKELEFTNSILRKSEEKFRFTLDNMIVGCQILDYDWRYTYINEAADVHNRISKEYLLGNKYMDMWPGIETTEVFAIIKKCMEERSFHHFENEFIFPDGSNGWFELSVQPVQEGVMILSNNVTERKLAEEGIINLNRELEQKVTNRTIQLQEALKDLESFSYSVSHDLRAPLRHIIGFIEILCKKKADNLDGDGKRYLSIITSSAKEMGVLIDDLLSFSRIGRSAVKKTQLDMNSLINGIIEENREEISNRNIKITLNSLPPVSADPNLLRQVWVNLIANSIKYTGKEENPEIEIGFHQDTEGIYYIKDNGAGFDMNYYDKLFGVFQRLHSSGEFEGTGIGLANVKRIIDKHEGKIWAEGKVGEGAVFYFTLPV